MAGLLLDHLWQSTLFAAAASLLALALRRHAAGVRYWLWFAAAAKFLVPFAIIAWAATGLAAHLHAQTPVPQRLELAWQALAPMTAPAPPAPMHALPRPPLDAMRWAAAAWALGTATILARHAVQWRSLGRILARGAPLALPTALPAVEAGVAGPAVIGFLRPVLVLPPGLTRELTPAELEAVLEHELHHARRRDNLLALPLLLAQALFWFHPLIWWIGRRLLAERERACDEAVLQSGLDAQTYARGLLEVCRLGLEPSPVIAAGIGGANLKRRIRQIMADQPPRRLGARGRLMLATAAGAALALPLAAGLFTTVPAASARWLADLARPAVSAAPEPMAAAAARPQAPPAHRATARPESARLVLLAAPSPLTAAPALARPVETALGLVRRTAAPRFQPIRSEPPPPAVEPASGPSRADAVRALADRTAYVSGADLGGAPLALRPAGACPTAGVSDAERRIGETVSTAFDGRVRRFVDEALAGRIGPRDLSPAMAAAVDKALPTLQPALAAFSGSGSARLIGEDRSGRDVYLVRTAAGYVLVLVDDLGQIEAALFCAAG